MPEDRTTAARARPFLSIYIQFIYILYRYIYIFSTAHTYTGSLHTDTPHTCSIGTRADLYIAHSRARTCEKSETTPRPLPLPSYSHPSLYSSCRDFFSPDISVDTITGRVYKSTRDNFVGNECTNNFVPLIFSPLLSRYYVHCHYNINYYDYYILLLLLYYYIIINI